MDEYGMARVVIGSNEIDQRRIMRVFVCRSRKFDGLSPLLYWLPALYKCSSLYTMLHHTLDVNLSHCECSHITGVVTTSSLKWLLLTIPTLWLWGWKEEKRITTASLLKTSETTNPDYE
eukprot:scaffold256_cov159-Amphora_coffeaeformis.AAC.1